jgi:hypothetical protein
VAQVVSWRTSEASLETAMNQRLLLATGAALLCVASAGNAQTIAPTATFLRPPAYVPGQNTGLTQGVPAAPRAGVPGSAAPTAPDLQSASLKPLTQPKPGPNAHPGPIEKAGDLKPYRFGYGLSKYDTASMQKKPDIPGRYNVAPAPADR